MKRFLLLLLGAFIVGCTSSAPPAATSSPTPPADAGISIQELVGEWQYAGKQGDGPDARIPGFLKEHGYIFAEDGTWEARDKSTGISPGTFEVKGDSLALTGKIFEGDSTATVIKVEADMLLMMTDPTISEEDKPLKTRYKRVVNSEQAEQK